MMRLMSMVLFVGTLTAPLTAVAADGSRQAAGGGFMSSYVNDPYHDPRSLHSQRNGTGQILGQPMLSERAGATVSRRGLVDPHWEAGNTGRRQR